MYLPSKITIRLDNETRRRFEKYLSIKINKSCSDVVRRALSLYLIDELAKLDDERAALQFEERPLGDKFALTKPKGQVKP